MKLKLILFFSFFAPSSQGWSAACCGGGFAAPAVIAGDEKAQLTTSYSLTEVVVESVDNRGLWRKANSHQRIQTLKLEGAHIFKDRFQVGLSVPVLQRSRESSNSTGLGDTAISLGYEYLPDWNYNPWRPKGIGYLQLILPTGKSRADSETGGLDSRGNGFWALGIGSLLTKTWSKWDSFITFEAHRSQGKRISNSQFTGDLEPGFGGNAGLGLGYNLKDFRFGGSLTSTYEDPVRMVASTGFVSPGAEERYSTATASLSYLSSDEWSGTLSYSDQTLFGSPLNTSLGRGVALQVQRRWSR